MIDLNIVTHFYFEPAIWSHQEVALLQKGAKLVAEARKQHKEPPKVHLWSPTTTDFKAIVHPYAFHECASLLEALSIIAIQKKGSVGRVNIFAHGDRDLVGFQGRVVAPTKDDEDVSVEFTKIKEKLVHLNLESVRELKDNPTDTHTIGKVSFTFDHVKTRFSDNAVIFIYACNSGASARLVQETADVFGVAEVSGFKQQLVFCPKYTDTAIVDRKRFGIDKPSSPTPCENNPSVTSNFYTLVPYAAYHRSLLSRRGPPRKKRTP